MKKLLLSLTASVLLVPSILTADYNVDEEIERMAFEYKFIYFKGNPYSDKEKSELKSRVDLRIKRFVRDYIIASYDANITYQRFIGVATQLMEYILLGISEQQLKAEIAQMVTPDEYAIVLKIVSDTEMQVNKLHKAFDAAEEDVRQGCIRCAPDFWNTNQFYF